MTAVLVVNLLTVGLALVLPNETLKWHSYLLYGVQLVTIVPYLAWRAFYAKNLFVPTLFAACYYLVNLTFGGYLVPRSFGWNKEYAAVALSFETYNLIVPYLLLANIVLFLVSCATINAAARITPDEPSTEGGLGRRSRLIRIAAEGACIATFFSVTVLPVYSAFSFQLAILVVHLTELARQRLRHRFAVYALYLVGLVALNFLNKREIAMTLFLMLFVEAFYGRHRLRMTVRSVLTYSATAVGFLGLILTASVLRGYGGFEPASALDAVRLVPRYINSDAFVDGVTDNLELNYNYGSAVNAVSLTLDRSIPYQYGASLWKVLFLPVPRDVFPAKPESVMQLYTRVYAPDLWADEGSLPVIVPSEMFVNFGFFGLLPFALVWIGINRLFLGIETSAQRSFASYSCIFLVVSVLMFARGSGLEQYLLYYLIAAPVLLLGALVLPPMRIPQHAR